MPETYKVRHGVDWEPQLSDEFIDLTVAKKWREYRDKQGVLFPDPHVRLIDAARSLLPAGTWSVSPWSEEHAYDFVNYSKNVTWGCASSSKSNDYGLFAVLHWILDPFRTTCLVGSTSLVALKSRTWEAIVRYHAHIRNNSRGLLVPGMFTRTGYAIVNVVDKEIAESQGAKASIQGRALNEGGTLQGAHIYYVFVLVDEAATLNNHPALRTALTNLRSGATDFRVAMLANPEDWSDPSCQYCEPEGGPGSVGPDTGEWVSRMGYHVRHHDGMKSPRVLEPDGDEKYPYLIGGEDIKENLRDCGGNEDAADMWKMVRGFPRPAGSAQPTVLDFQEAVLRKCREPLVPTGADFKIASMVGCDPAWTSGGDEARWYTADLVISSGVPMLVYREPDQLHLRATSGVTSLEQLVSQAYARYLADPTISPERTVYDGSGNQSLCGGVAMRTGLRGLDVIYSERASDKPLERDGATAMSAIYDRGSESWAVLAAFIRNGQVRNLPDVVVQQMCTRRWASKTKNSSTLARPLRMEAKESWASRESRGSGPSSPDDSDAASLCALGFKELLGVVPGVGAVPNILPAGALPGRQASRVADKFYEPGYGDGWETGGYTVEN